MIRIIATHEIDDYWEEVAPLLKAAVEMDGCATLQTVKEWLKRGDYQLWIAGDYQAAATTTIDIFPASQVLTVVHLGGSGLVEWMNEGLGSIERWALEHDCDRIRINGRDEWARVLPGYHRKAVVTEKVLQ